MSGLLLPHASNTAADAGKFRAILPVNRRKTCVFLFEGDGQGKNFFFGKRFEAFIWRG